MRILLVLAVSSALFGVSDDEVCRGCSRQKGDSYARVYDADRVERVSGTIMSVDKIQGGRGASYGVHVMMQTRSGEYIDVHLGPSWYISRKGLRLEPGETISVTGSQVMLDGQHVMIAQKISTANGSARLRDENGHPAWASTRSWSD